MKRRQIAINNNSGAFTDVLATIPSRLLEVSEDEASTLQGMQVKNFIDNFATTDTFGTGEGFTIPNASRYPNKGPVLGCPAINTVGQWNYRAADKLLSVRSNGASGTTLRVIEDE